MKVLPSIKPFKSFMSNIYDVVNTLSAKGFINKTYIDKDPDSFLNANSSSPSLSQAQMKVYNQIKPYIHKNKYYSDRYQ